MPVGESESSGFSAGAVNILQDPERLENEVGNEAVMAKLFLEYYTLEEPSAAA